MQLVECMTFSGCLAMVVGIGRAHAVAEPLRDSSGG
jgi:hypothetical protein